MNLTLLDRPQLEAIVLNPSSESQQPLVCSDNAVLDYIPAPSTARETRLRHVLAAAHELLTRIATDAVKGRSLIDSPSVMKDFLRVYFACAEAIQNAMKHADGATGIWVTLTESPHGLHFEVRDDGAGFVPTDGSGQGLRNMRDRIEGGGGQLTLDAAPGRGTRVTGAIPL